ncbi:hypothetical protein SAY87_009043 [Trapa incisa]|nr:hypothetical protein SAY87_009043 [Trapa incisa]
MGVGQETVEEFSSSPSVNSGMISVMRFVLGLQREEMLGSGKRTAWWNQSWSIMPTMQTELQLPVAAIAADLRAQREKWRWYDPTRIKIILKIWACDGEGCGGGETRPD